MSWTNELNAQDLREPPKTKQNRAKLKTENPRKHVGAGLGKNDINTGAAVAEAGVKSASAGVGREGFICILKEAERVQVPRQVDGRLGGHREITVCTILLAQGSTCCLGIGSRLQWLGHRV